VYPLNDRTNERPNYEEVITSTSDNKLLSKSDAEMEASIVSLTHQGTIKKSRFPLFSQKGLLQSSRQKMHEAILKHMFLTESAPDPTRDLARLKNTLS
jgi:hypothetical protein